MNWKVQGQITVGHGGDEVRGWRDDGLVWKPGRAPEILEYGDRGGANFKGHAYEDGKHIHPDRAIDVLDAIHKFAAEARGGEYAVAISGDDSGISKTSFT